MQCQQSFHHSHLTDLFYSSAYCKQQDSLLHVVLSDLLYYCDCYSDIPVQGPMFQDNTEHHTQQNRDVDVDEQFTSYEDKGRCLQLLNILNQIN